MFIIIEGCDGTGKSTLAEILKRKHGFEIIHFSYPRNTAECEIMFDMYKKFLTTHDNYILDRCWYSDLVYGPLYRGKASISPEQLRELEDILFKTKSQVYYCIEQENTIKERLQERGDDYVTDLSMLTKIIDAYDDVMCRVMPGISFKIYSGDSTLLSSVERMCYNGL